MGAYRRNRTMTASGEITRCEMFRAVLAWRASVCSDLIRLEAVSSKCFLQIDHQTYDNCVLAFRSASRGASIKTGVV